FHDPFLHQCLLMVGFGLDLESDGSSVSPPAAHCQRQNPQNRHSISGSLPGSSAPGQPKGFRLKSVPAPLPPQARRAGRPDGMKRSETDLRDFPAGAGEQGPHLGQEGVHLLRTAADVQLRVQHGLHLRLGHAEGRLRRQAGEQVAGLPLLHPGGGGHGAGADDLVERLPVAAPLDALHHQVLRSNEGQVLPAGPVHDLLVDVEPVGDVLTETQ
ncbi:DUF4241 domain-containing protein, partial [Dysosmobacter welbionis]